MTMFSKQGTTSTGFLPPVRLATWQGRGGFARGSRVPVSVFPSAYPCGPP